MNASAPIPKYVLPGLVAAQLLGTALWFSSSAALPSLIEAWSLDSNDIGLLVSAVQAGFIVGTFGFALTNLADRYSASRVFFLSTLLGAGANLLFAYRTDGFAEALVYRFITGIALAGIYPVGMKLVISWAPDIVGKSLGWLVGAVTLGSGLPFLSGFAGRELPWQQVLASASVLAIVSGLAVLAIGSGPHLQPARNIELRMIYRVFATPAYRGAAFGYFGHMWELYAFWVLSPLMITAALVALGLDPGVWTNLGVFLIFLAGGVGCVVGGIASLRFGSRNVAALSMAVSGTICLLAPLLFRLSPWLYLLGLLIWGIFIVSDSPQFSALSARSCPPEYVATALTVQNGVGFAITIISIELTTRLWISWGPSVSWILAIGPVLGLVMLLHPGNRADDHVEPPPRVVSPWI